LKEVASSRPKADIEVLGLLPDDVLPEMDGVFAQQLNDTYDDASWDELVTKLAVIERYATGRTFRQVEELYSAYEKEWNHAQRALFFSYFLRVEPVVGRKLIEQGLRNKKESNTLLTDIANIRASADLEPSAVEALSNFRRRSTG